MKSYVIHAEQVEPRWIAVVQRHAAAADFSSVIPSACGEVWNFIRSNNIPHLGLNLVIYKSHREQECGVIVPQPFPSEGNVTCSTTPTGLAAWTEHWGPYDRLGEANDAILLWCKSNNHEPAGASWEVYDHWNDDPAKLRTWVYFLLKTDS